VGGLKHIHWLYFGFKTSSDVGHFPLTNQVPVLLLWVSKKGAREESLGFFVVFHAQAAPCAVRQPPMSLQLTTRRERYLLVSPSAFTVIIIYFFLVFCLFVTLGLP
jgi:hypothetical protein